MPYRIALIGNQNCGKTTLFNRLTGAHRRVGNYPGVTVEAKSGTVRSDGEIEIVDLPGVYSLHPYSEEEKVSREFLLRGKPDGIINIADANCLARGLFLTLQIIDIGIPTVLALNMMDEVKANGGKIDTQALSKMLGVPVVPVSAGKGEGTDELVKVLKRTVTSGAPPTPCDYYGGITGECVGSVRRAVLPYAERAGLPDRFCALAAMEDDRETVSRISLDGGVKAGIEREIRSAEKAEKSDIYTLLAREKYNFIEKAVSRCVTLPVESREKRRSERIDKIITDRHLAIPFFLLIILSVFFLTFNVIGGALQDAAEFALGILSSRAGGMLSSLGVNGGLVSLITDGIFGGVGSVLSFLPVILVLFFFLSVLEDSGYMARVAFITDGLFGKIGLSGKSFVPMLMGFGCTVPAVMATRTLPSERDRRVTMMLLPYVSCSAKIPIFAMFASVFFERGKRFLIVELYIIGIVLALCAAVILKKIYPAREESGFLMELPNYRFPSAASVLRLIWEKAKDFISRAFTVILLSSVAVWFLGHFGVGLSTVSDESYSLLYIIGKKISCVFRPIGFDRPELAAALLVGLTAKESVVSTLGILSGVGGISSLFSGKLSAFSFLIFTLLYTPCVAAFSAVKGELHSAGRAFCFAALQCTVAYFVSFLFYNISCLIISVI